MKNTKIVVCYHFGRSGSTLLSNSLSKNPNIHSYSEIFTILDQKGQKSEKLSLKDALAIIEHARQKCNKGIAFFEIKPMNFLQSSDCRLFKLHKQLVQFHDAKTVYLQRENVLKRIVSSDKAALSGHYHSTSKAPSKEGRFNLNLKEGYDFDSKFYYTDIKDRLRLSVDLEKRIKGQLRKDASDFRHISYERNLEKPPKLFSCIADLCNWLNVPNHTFEVALKPTSNGLKNDLKNYSELKDVLSKSTYLKYVD